MLPYSVSSSSLFLLSLWLYLKTFRHLYALAHSYPNLQGLCFQVIFGSLPGIRNIKLFIIPCSFLIVESHMIRSRLNQPHSTFEEMKISEIKASKGVTKSHCNWAWCSERLTICATGILVDSSNTTEPGTLRELGVVWKTRRHVPWGQGHRLPTRWAQAGLHIYYPIRWWWLLISPKFFNIKLHLCHILKIICFIKVPFYVGFCCCLQVGFMECTHLWTHLCLVEISYTVLTFPCSSISATLRTGHGWATNHVINACFRCVNKVIGFTLLKMLAILISF